ncbi:uncharacterized protein LOC143180944 [Calliopsis andreniformis]|uniref:uncharacterized protein LOC143180944 n=1 Tax=Calliopsis andreniformis TaxID=337506 RepID=UPI003FCCC37D
MIERWHRSLKTAIMCHNNPQWVDTLPTVLLGLRTSFKEDLQAFAAEMLYETDSSPYPFMDKFRQYIRNIKPVPTAHHSKRTPFTHKTLYTCSHVFVRVDSARKPLEPPYEGPFQILESTTDHIFKIDYKGRETNISTERFKPAFMETIMEQSEKEVRTYPGKSMSEEGANRSITAYLSPPRRVSLVLIIAHVNFSVESTSFAIVKK